MNEARNEPMMKFAWPSAASIKLPLPDRMPEYEDPSIVFPYLFVEVVVTAVRIMNHTNITRGRFGFFRGRRRKTAIKQ